MKKLFPPALVVLGVVFAAAGVYTFARGVDARRQVHGELAAQRIVTPPDASLPNRPVVDEATAKSQADIIARHAAEATGGLTYAEMGKFANPAGTPKGTNDEAAAVKDAAGKPVPNQARSTAFQAAALRTSLYASVMAFELSLLVIGLGAMLVVTGGAFAGIGVSLRSRA